VANASAISGEYLSAASFLGVAGLILREGADALWFPIAFTTGYLALVLFVAAPLRRSGAYTVPDFAVARLNSDGLRRLCTVFVLVIGWLYLLPQLQGAGLALTTLTALPAWSGIAGAGLVVVLTVVGGGMRSITFVQAFQYWLKLTALVVPAVFVLGLFISTPAASSGTPRPTSGPTPGSTCAPTSSSRPPNRSPWSPTARSTASGSTGRWSGRRAGTRSTRARSCGSPRECRCRRSPARRRRTASGSRWAPGTPSTSCSASTPC
jgi:Na+/proline symporter